jgi:hypothetical protein
LMSINMNTSSTLEPIGSYDKVSTYYHCRERE